MDLRTALAIFALFLQVHESQQKPGLSLNGNITTTPQPNNISKECGCPGPPPTSSTTCPSPTPSLPSLGLLSISWVDDCKGKVVLSLHPPSFPPSSPVCHSSLPLIQKLLSSPCESQRGCEGSPDWGWSQNKQEGYDITENGEMKEKSCESLMLQCTPQTDEQAELQAYKVVTALLCCVLIVLLLIRFTRPTIKALQSRLSDRRQNRWVGPTQSHSVSYHRGKGVVQNQDREKRLSYPALERLTVNDSREPSSNRNSDYNY
ncbi:uncharacterized protein LOC122871216 isoform X4 [Xyrichtys novacula]|uniref:Uncharacterized protein LOC122871216 isoform X4 n=1 Tax=Xyrichtys novacula TaxID=13765 RepID=A0AAV1EX53_XYRNO|nr:uncharacterized protein LOC122871216 isoform X4 [Xyrichtys novacula]